MATDFLRRFFGQSGFSLVIHPTTDNRTHAVHFMRNIFQYSIQILIYKFKELNLAPHITGGVVDNPHEGAIPIHLR